MIKRYLNICGINLEFRYFDSSINDTKKIRFEIFNYYKYFFLKDKPKKIDYKIFFISECGIKISHPLNVKQISTNIFEVKNSNTIITRYTISIFQFELILLFIIENFYKKNGLILHCSSVMDSDKNSYLFIGKQGAGKSTILNLLRKKYIPLSDDNLLIVNIKSNFYAYQIPFLQSEKKIFKSSIRSKIKKIFFLVKSNFCKEEVETDRNYIFNRLSNNYKSIYDIKINKFRIKQLLKLLKKNFFSKLYFSKNEATISF